MLCRQVCQTSMLSYLDSNCQTLSSFNLLVTVFLCIDVIENVSTLFSVLCSNLL